MKEIIAFDRCPMSSGNEMMFHFLEVAYDLRPSRQLDQRLEQSLKVNKKS